MKALGLTRADAYLVLAQCTPAERGALLGAFSKGKIIRGRRRQVELAKLKSFTPGRNYVMVESNSNRKGIVYARR